VRPESGEMLVILLLAVNPTVPSGYTTNPTSASMEGFVVPITGNGAARSNPEKNTKKTMAKTVKILLNSISRFTIVCN
jgi:hypothetical protein